MTATLTMAIMYLQRIDESAVRETHWSSVGSAVDSTQELCAVLNVHYRGTSGSGSSFLEMSAFVCCVTAAALGRSSSDEIFQCSHLGSTCRGMPASSHQTGQLLLKRMMSSMQATPPFHPPSEEEEAAGQDNAPWANNKREGLKETPSPSSHDQPHLDELQPIREKLSDAEWENVVPAAMDNESSKGCSIYSYRTNSTSPLKPEECSRDRGEPVIGLTFGTPERRKGSLADVVDTLKQKKLVELTKTEQDVLSSLEESALSLELRPGLSRAPNHPYNGFPSWRRRDLFTNDQPQPVGLDYKYSQWDMPGSPLLLSLAAGQPAYVLWYRGIDRIGIRTEPTCMERLLSKDWKERVDRLNANELLGEVKGAQNLTFHPKVLLESHASKFVELHPYHSPEDSETAHEKLSFKDSYELIICLDNGLY
ncbi:hypothetical protein L3Q82_007198 [Scortum barcoo]|uniref:Uncharacterized protein n=1 Tax=Scortum barcoo TaxID=214431 RepID=A0ACB8WSL8_9TELE|nr:hypothetical protein L3Q82_007198 [Scortum barcoo]